MSIIDVDSIELHDRRHRNVAVAVSALPSPSRTAPAAAAAIDDAASNSYASSSSSSPCVVLDTSSSVAASSSSSSVAAAASASASGTWVDGLPTVGEVDGSNLTFLECADDGDYFDQYSADDLVNRLYMIEIATVASMFSFLCCCCRGKREEIRATSRHLKEYNYTRMGFRKIFADKPDVNKLNMTNR
jgi:hypothetical protein